MKFFTLFTFFLLIAGSINSQTWEQVSPYPSGFDYYDMYLDASGTGIFVGFWGIITKTTNFGENFRNVVSGTTEKLNGVERVDENIYIAVGNRGTVLRSADGGEIWRKVNIEEDLNLFDIHFINSSIGIITGAEGLLLRTSDGGLNWERIDIGFTQNLTHIADAGENLLLIWGYHTKSYFESTDLGLNWKEVKIDGAVSVVHFSDENKGIIFIYDAINRGSKLATSDGGKTWTKVTDTAPNITSVCFADNSVGLACDYLGRSYRTTDGGITWVATGYSGIFNIMFINNDLQFALGNRHIILRSRDMGINWERLDDQIGPVYLTKVVFTKNKEAYIIGSHNLFFKTTDGGLTFKNINNEFPCGGLNDIISVGENELIILCNSRILKSYDGGETWEAQSLGTDQLYSIAQIQNTFWILSSNNLVFRSDDGGETWEVINDQLGSHFHSSVVPEKIVFVNKSVGFIYLHGHPHNVIWTKDGGYNWEKADLFKEVCPTCIQFPDEKTGYVIGEAIHKTEDGGLTWTKINSTLPQRVQAMYFRNESTGYAIVDFGKILKTQDGGLTWEEQLFFTPGYVNSISFDEEGTGIAVGTPGIILRVEEQPLSTHPGKEARAISAMEVFPNPAGQEITINSENFNGHSVLRIYNMNGKPVSDIRGNYNGSPLNISHLPAGAYFMLHTNGNIIEKGVFVKQ